MGIGCQDPATGRRRNRPLPAETSNGVIPHLNLTHFSPWNRLRGRGGFAMHWVQSSVKAVVVAALLLWPGLRGSAQGCGATGVALQVLGSGGPELQDKRASTSYLIWENGHARVLLDAGGGSALRFGESGAQMSGVDVFLFSHFHVDHSSDFPAMIFSSWLEDRNRPLPVFGPSGNKFKPSTTEYVHNLFSDPHGTYRYLSDLVDPGAEGSYKLQPH